MTVKEICRIVQETKIVLFELKRVFDGHVCEIDPGEPIPEKYADRKVLQLESVAEEEDGVIYLIMDN